MCGCVCVWTLVCGCVWTRYKCVLDFSRLYFYSCPPTAPNCLLQLRNTNRTEPVLLGACFNVLTAELRSGPVRYRSAAAALGGFDAAGLTLKEVRKEMAADLHKYP